MKYKGVIFSVFVFFLSGNLFSQPVAADTAREISCQFYLDTALKQQVYLFADQKAEFPGGEKAMLQFVQSNLKYPNDGSCVGGTVFVEFVVDADGKIIRKAIRRSIHKAIDEEALKVIDKFPRFIPAKCEGETVLFRITIPVKFMIK